MKAMVSLAAAVLFLTMAVAIPFEADECPNCDCYQFPLPAQCEKCCSIATGTVTAVTDTAITVKTGDQTKKETVEKFVITPRTKINAQIQKDSLVTVYYHRGGNIAERIDMVAALEGLIEPASMEDPPVPAVCPVIPVGAFRVYVGDSLGWSLLPEMTAISFGETPIVRIRRTPKGIAVEARLFEPDGHPAAVIVDNRVYLNPDGYIHPKRPDRHTLILYDKGDQLIFAIQYLNPHSVAIIGKIDLPNSLPLLIRRDGIMAGNGFLVRGNCAGNPDVLFQISPDGTFRMGVIR
jgi:hypothetical protein